MSMKTFTAIIHREEVKDRITCSIEDGKLILAPTRQSQYTLEELLAEVAETSEEIDWGNPQGKEIW